MQFDIEAEIEKVEYADNFVRAEVLDRLLVLNRPFDEFKLFFDTFSEHMPHVFEKLVFIDRLFEAEMMEAYENKHLTAVYEMLSGQNYFFAMRCAAKIMMERRIPVERRALFWHIMKSAYYRYSGLPGQFFARRIFADNEHARRCCRHYAGDTPEGKFINNTEDEFRRLKLPPGILDAVRSDSVSVFEMTRHLAGTSLRVSLMLFILEKDAVQCFTYLLSRYPRQIFKMRTPEEWLFTVCRNAREKMAIAAVDEIERQFPGIVAQTRDPWGNTLLWNTLANGVSTRKLQAELIRLGCNPTAENELGLSYALVEANTPEKYKNEHGGNL